MKNKTSDVRTLRSRQLLSDALIELMKSKPLEKITVNDIVKKANVARTTFYAQFKDKDQFVNEIIQDKLKELRKIVTPNFDIADEEHFEEASTIYYVKYYEAYLANAEFFKVFIGPNGLPGFVDILTENGIKAYTAIFENAKVDEFPLPPKYIVQYIVSAHIGLGIQWMKNDFKESPEYMARIQNRLTYRGLLRGLKLEQAVTLLK